MRQSHKTILLWIMLILMFVLIYNMFTDSGTRETQKNVTAFKQEISDVEKAKAIRDVEIQPGPNNDAKYVITYNAPGPKAVVHGEYPGTITEMLTKSGIDYEVKRHEESTLWKTVLVSWVPMLF